MGDKYTSMKSWQTLQVFLLFPLMCINLLMVGCDKAPDRPIASGIEHLRPEGHGRPRQQAKLAPLDANDPAQAAVVQWHRALVDNNFAAYMGVEVQPAGPIDIEMNRLWFDSLRPGVPAVVFVSDETDAFDGLLPAEDAARLKGLRSFMLVGCAASRTNEAFRRIALVSARSIGGHWFVYGGSFGPANEGFAGECPVVPGGASNPPVGSP